MASIGDTTARLARYRRQFERAAAANGSRLRQGDTDSGHLREVKGFGSNPGNLRMLTYVPRDLPAGAPLVVVLHGCTQTAAGYDVGAGWSTLADRYGFALLLPEQQRTNNPNTCFNWFLPGDIARGKGEAQSIRLMIERAVTDHHLDRDRVFVTGLSAGGAMAAVMLATYPDVFAGGAIIAGLPYRTAGSVQEALDAMYQGRSMPARAWGDLVRAASGHRGPWPKVSIWHGTADATVLPLNADELVKQWTDLHDVSGAPAAQERVDGHVRRVWRSAAGEPVVESYTIKGMGHGTPIAAAGQDGAGKAGSYILESGISSSYRIAQFWGIAERRRGENEWPAAARSERNSAPAPKPAESGQMRGGAPANAQAGRRATRPVIGGFDPGAVINRALSKAGLLKR